MALGTLFPVSQAEDVLYQVPNPFLEPIEGYYSIKSIQTVTSALGESTQVEVVDFFSLTKGLSYSIHRNSDDTSQVFTLISDGTRGKSYIVRNPDSRDEFDCELDHLHHHRRVFPWQYFYARAVPGNSNLKSDSFIYGVGAIWLNVIQSKVESSQFRNEALEISWQLEEGNLSIKLIFEKRLADRGINSNHSHNQSIVSFIEMRRRATLNGINGESSIASEFNTINVLNFETYAENDKLFDILSLQLKKCRKETSMHHLFPSFMKAINSSPQRLYAIEYVSTKFGKLRIDERYSGKYSSERGRHVWTSEFVREWFSFKREAQAISYEGLPPADKSKSAKLEQVSDIFLKRFTENETGRSSRHSSVSYHMIEQGSQIETCERGYDKLLPQDHLMSRPIQFHRKTRIQLSAKLIGLGALLMNAADIHYKEFKLFKKTISVVHDASNLYDKNLVQVDEWQLNDAKTSRTLHFYFKELQVGHHQHEMSDLVRIDISDIKSSSPVKNNEERGLIERFDIISVAFEIENDEIESIFSPAPCCGSQKNDPSNIDDGEDEDANLSSDDDYFRYIPKVDDDAHANGLDQREGENFEFEPGSLMESFQFPDFFEYLGSDSSYMIESTIEIMSSDTETRKQLLMRETVNIDKNWATIKVFQIEHNSGELVPDFEYYIDYKSETVFKISNIQRDDNCVLEEDIEISWLKLFSKKNEYYIIPDESIAVKIKGYKLRLYGVGALWQAASQSDYADFVGMSKSTMKVGSDESTFKEVLWSLADDEDNGMSLSFSFLWNLTQWELDTGNQISRRTIDLLSLRSISTAELLNNDEQSTSLFNRFKLQVNSFSKEEGAGSLQLPEQCHEAYNSAKESLKQRFSYKSTIPSLFDFIGSADSYSLDYTIHHFQRTTKRGQAKQAAGPDIVRVAEYFDKATNRGRLTIGHQQIEQEIYIDRSTEFILQFAPSTKTCKRISSIKTLVDLGDIESIDDLMDHRADKLHGLAGLWQRLAQMNGTSLEVTNQKIDGHLCTVHTYKANTAWAGNLKLNNVLSYKVEVRFAEHYSKEIEHNREKREFVLDKIEIHPKQLKRSVATLMHSTIIKVKSISRDLPGGKWLLPESCLSLIGSDGSNIEADLFPKLINSVKTSDNLYMRAEISTYSPMMSFDRKLFLMDEWLHNRNIRMKTTNLKRNLDILIYSASGESFDLSNPYHCDNFKLPKFDSNETSERHRLIEFWRDDTTLVEDPSELYYGPLSLWWLAEKNIANVKLETSIDIAPRPSADINDKKPSESLAHRLAREFRTEIWKVTSPITIFGSKWTYEMHFEKYSIFDEHSQEIKERHVLQRISLELSDIMNSNLEIEVVNYGFKLSETDIIEQFMIPEGFNCERSLQLLKAHTRDDLLLDTSQSYSFNYEASLELIEGDDFKKLNLPTLIGSLTKSGEKNANSMNLYKHFYQKRSSKGILLSSAKNVYDIFNSIVYEIDRLTGLCQVRPSKLQFNWRLQFPVDINRVETINIDDLLFGTLFLDTVKQNYKPLNRFTSKGLSINTYEKSYGYLKLTKHLFGPVTVLRRYAAIGQPPLTGNSKLITRMQNSISIRVFIFDETRSQIKATLSITLNQVANVQLVDIVRSASVAECYDNDERISAHHNTGSGAFALEYKIRMREWAREHVKDIEEQFVEVLIDAIKILPTQLNGPPRIEFTESKIKQMKVYFNLLEPPTAIHYFNQRVGFTISDNQSAHVKIKLLASSLECSKWCDQVSCVAMSYCSDRTCRIMTEVTVPAGIAGYSKETLAFLLSFVVLKSDCTYYSTTTIRLKTLESIVDHLETAINDSSSNDGDSDFLSLKMNNITTPPSRFYKLNQAHSPQSLEADDSSKSMSSYQVLKNNIKLDTAKLMQLKNKKNTFKMRINQASNYADCLNICKEVDCILVSHCKQGGSCITISGEVDLLEIEASAEVDEPGCTLVMQNFLENFAKFEDTLKPVSFERQIDDLSSIQCAVACQDSANWLLAGSEKFVCLSFDWCQSVDVPSEHKKAYCLLQKNHLIQDNFDRLIFKSQQRSSNETIAVIGRQNGEQLICNHYSRNVLIDFLELPNKQFMATNTILDGFSVEKCAIECQLDDQCWAFEYCAPGTCYLIRARLIRKQESIEGWRIDFEKQLTESNKCSVYITRHLKETYTMKMERTVTVLTKTNQLLRDHNKTLPIPMLKILFYVGGSTLLGCLFQIVYIKLNIRFFGCL